LGGSRLKASLDSLQDPISKITREKWTGVVAQIVECLLRNFKALNSNPSSTKNKNKNKKTQQGIAHGGQH
jgi:hypothetical protein